MLGFLRAVRSKQAMNGLACDWLYGYIAAVTSAGPSSPACRAPAQQQQALQGGCQGWPAARWDFGNGFGRLFWDKMEADNDGQRLVKRVGPPATGREVGRARRAECEGLSRFGWVETKFEGGVGLRGFNDDVTSCNRERTWG